MQNSRKIRVVVLLLESFAGKDKEDLRVYGATEEVTKLTCFAHSGFLLLALPVLIVWSNLTNSREKRA